MKFVISRTSTEDKPCEEAFASTYTECIGKIVKQRKCWCVKINTLEELLKLKEKYGQLILRDAHFAKSPTLEIEIYDDWRE